MTVSYSDHFIKLLFRWKASIWKAVLPSLLCYLGIYYAIFIPLYLLLDYDQKLTFRKVRNHCESYLQYFPITFLLGFYVSAAVTRWWNQFMLLGWPDRFMFMLIGFAPDDRDEIVIIRRNIGRWMNLQAVLYYQGFSQRVYKRFPSLQSVVNTGLMTQLEKDRYDSTPGPFGKCTLIHVWIQKAINDLRTKNCINDVEKLKLYDELASYRGGIATLTLYDWAPVPLVYTQVVTIATWGYFMIAMIADMNIHTNASDVAVPPQDIYFPLFLVLQFLFYMGWLKVAQQLFDPFGEDDDDFEMNYLIDRNASMAENIATTMAASWPEYSTESYLDITKATPLSYTAESLKSPGHYPEGHLGHLKIKEQNSRIVDLKEAEEYLLAHYKHDKHSIKKAFKRENKRKTKAIEEEGMIEML